MHWMVEFMLPRKVKMLNLFIILLLYIQKNASGFYSPQNNKSIKNKQRIHIINNIINSDQTLNLNGNSISNNGNYIIVNGKKSYLEKIVPSFRMSPDDQGNDNDVNNENEFLFIDCISILIAAQLLGLNDAITDPDFLKNGGFAGKFLIYVYRYFILCMYLELTLKITHDEILFCL